jgi:hypothetical protein
MSSSKQIDANRKNALRSTGPKTPEGKAAVARNAIKHGLLARDLVLPGEQRQDCEAVFAALAQDLQPAGATEEFLVQQMASAQWRLQRFTRIETGLLDYSMTRLLKNERRDGEEPEDPTPEEQYQHDTLIMGNAFSWEDFWKVARYENQIRRSFYKALEELRRLRLKPLGPGESPACPDVQPTPEKPLPASQTGVASPPQPEQTKADETKPITASAPARPAKISVTRPVSTQETAQGGR